MAKLIVFVIGVFVVCMTLSAIDYVNKNQNYTVKYDMWSQYGSIAK